MQKARFPFSFTRSRYETTRLQKMQVRLRRAQLRHLQAESSLFQVPKEEEMKVNPADGTCRECGGTLAIVGISDDSMTVLCDEWT